MAKPTQSPEYRALARRYAELVKAGRLGITREEQDEMAAVCAEMEVYELAHRQEQNTIQLAASDYDQLGEIGHLGGTEFL